MKHYILLHGAWCGGWIWDFLVDEIRGSGHNVVVPDLPGHGNNFMQFSKVNLSVYVDFVVNLVNSIDGKVLLVAHSMSGVLISQVAEKIPEKIEKLVYISAFIPEFDGSIVKEEKAAINPSVALEVKIDNENFCISLDHSQKIRTLFFGCCTDDIYIYAISKMYNQPLRPFIETVSLTKDRFGTVEKVYIECLKDQAISIKDQRRMHNKVRCEVFAIDCDHFPQLSAPIDLFKILMKI